MNASNYSAQYLATFKNQTAWLGLYVSLRENGDSHSDAVETINLEMQMEARSH